MDTNMEMKISFSFSRRAALFVLAGFFLAWHPAFLGSETLNITTYYPAPYGGYVGIMTTDQTLLARDGGQVGIGLGSGGVPQYKVDMAGNLLVRGTNNSPTKADPNTPGSTLVYNTPGEGSTIRMVGSNSSRLYLENLNGTFRIINDGWSAELFTVAQNGDTHIGRDLYITNGILRNLCREVGYGIGASPGCQSGERVVAWYGDGTPRFCGLMLDPGGGALNSADAWVPHCVNDAVGVMLCCRIQP